MDPAGPIPILLPKGGEEKRPPDLHPFLPAPPLNCVIFASTNSGKGVLLLNMLLSSKMWRNHFKVCHLFSSTAYQGETMQKIREYAENTGVVRTHVDTTALQEIVALAEEEAADGKKATPTAVVVDDCCGDPGLSALGLLATKSRHLNISIFYLTQLWKKDGIPFSLRNNTTLFCQGRVFNVSEREKAVMELSGLFPNWEKHLREAEAKKYAFLIGDVRQRRVLLNFERVLEEF